MPIPSESGRWQLQFKAMCQEYRNSLPQRIEEIEVAWKNLQESGWAPEAFQEFLALLHRMSGTGATFGFTMLGNAARQLETYLESEIAIANRAPGPFHMRRIVLYLESIKQIALHLPPDGELEMPALAPALRRESPQKTEAERIVFIVDPLIQRAEELRAQLAHFSYEAETFSDIEHVTQALERRTPAVLLMDTGLLQNGEPGQSPLNEVRRRQRSNLPMVFLSDRSDIQTRLTAVKEGGVAYFVRPLQLGNLIKKLDALTEAEHPESFRILIVEDDPIMAHYLSSILLHNGLRTVAITDPLAVVQPLIDFRPDLILMDRYLQMGCDGLELAEVIRQDEAFLSIPIIFISTEMDNVRRLEVMRQGGGDDFLTKPIHPQVLIQSVITRAERYRSLSSFMLRDGLTGLLTHTRFKEQLQVETARANRHHEPLSLAILDIDFFKSVNDTHGHAVGDRVLQSLARMLVQRLRRTDVIGRLGGEEYAIILADSTPEEAFTVVNGLRQDFSDVRHQLTLGEFRVTFSAGIASTRDFPDAIRLSDEADKALYGAKRAGRNQVKLAPM
ncbi:MAG: diguanylate cyclase [Myxococcota bacterium]